MHSRVRIPYRSPFEISNLWVVFIFDYDILLNINKRWIHEISVSYTHLQLPHAIAVSLINSDNEKYETGKYIGDSYRDLTRIANINENLWSELFLRNSDYLLASIEAFEEQLDLIKVALKDNDERLLKDLFIKSSLRREKLEK